MKADFEKGTKICSKCKRELPISKFSKNKRASDGLISQCKECDKEYYENNKVRILSYRKTEKGRQVQRRASNKYKNTFGRKGRKRGNSGMLKRDYELTKEQLKRRNNGRKKMRSKNKNINAQSILIWYDGTLDNLTSEEYGKIQERERARQVRCAIRGCAGRTKPSEHFLFDFDLEKMLKDNVYCMSGGNKLYITKWWEGTIRHWTVNDGIWKEG